MAIMKTKYFLTVVSVLFLLWGCEKDEIDAELNYYENLFEIKDDPSDSVQHRVYELYKKYNVPIFFNDTLGKAFVKVNIQGDSIYRYELLDLSWSFTSGGNTSTYTFQYLASPEEKMLALDVAENYLESIFDYMRPYSMFLVRKTAGTYSKFVPTFRTLLFSDVLSCNTDAKMDKYITDVVCRIVSDYLVNNQNELVTKFASISNKAYYGQEYQKIVKNYPADFDSDVLIDPNATAEQIAKVCAVMGSVGFVSAEVDEYWDIDWDTFEEILVRKYYAPLNSIEDMEGYIREIITVSQDKFKERWGNMPLVMQKYKLIREYIRAK